MLLEMLTITTNAAVLSLIGYVVYNFMKVKTKLNSFFATYKMNAEEFLGDQIEENVDVDELNFPQSGEEIQEKTRERLSVEMPTVAQFSAAILFSGSKNC